MINGGTDRTLVPDPPRAVPRWFFVRRMQPMFVCGLVFVGLGGLILFCLPLWDANLWPVDDLMLDYYHARTTAILIDKRLIPYVHMGSRNPWKVAFRFTTPEGAKVESVGYTYDQTFANKARGEALEVEYYPTHAQRARPAGGYAASAPPWAGFVTIAPLLIGSVVMLVVVGLRSRSERKLLAYGVGTAAEIVRVQSVWYIHFGTRHPFDVHYRFHDHRRMEVTGQDRTYHYAWAEALKPGDKVGVVYHPRQPEVNVLWLHGSDAPS
ncbi:MAG: DUF3592 domain-containing protein [Planctomycetota bacterium]